MLLYQDAVTMHERSETALTPTAAIPSRGRNGCGMIIQISLKPGKLIALAVTVKNRFLPVELPSRVDQTKLWNRTDR